MYHKPQLGRFVLVSILVLSIATTFFVTYAGKLDAFLLVHIKILRDPVVNKTFKNLYIPTHTRATPYYIGMITGLVRHKMKHTSYKINKVWKEVYFMYRLVWFTICFFSLVHGMDKLDFIHNINEWHIIISLVVLQTRLHVRCFCSFAVWRFVSNDMGNWCKLDDYRCVHWKWK